MRTAVGLLLSGVICAGILATAVRVGNSPAPAADGAAATSIEPLAQARIVGEFSGFAGSEANARSLVRGLRQGGEIALAAGGRPGTTLRFSPPARPMNNESIHIALTLAREQLAQLGIAQPTPAQIKAVLAGGGIATRATGGAATPFLLAGILPMRAGGLGWAKIADNMGVSLGRAMGDKSRPAASASPAARRKPVAASAVTGATMVAVTGSDIPPPRGAGSLPRPVSPARATPRKSSGANASAISKSTPAARRRAENVTPPRSSASAQAGAERTAGITLIAARPAPAQRDSGLAPSPPLATKVSADASAVTAAVAALPAPVLRPTLVVTVPEGAANAADAALPDPAGGIPKVAASAEAASAVPRATANPLRAEEGDTADGQ